MLDRMRQGAQGWVSKLLMLLLVLSFGIWGVSGQFAGYGAGTLATVGDQEVTVPEFARTMEQVQRSGQQVPPEQVLNSLILNAALDDEADQYKLGVSDDHIAREIAADPRFQGQGGSFDRDVFTAILSNSGIDRDDYVRSLREDEIREQIASTLGAGVEVPQPMLEALYRFQTEERTISYFVVDATSIEPPGTPDPEGLQVYFDANKERFRTPEYRKLGLLVLDAAALADPAAITPEEVAAEYERRKENFIRPERRRIEQLRYDTPETAQQALASTEGGDFAALAQSRGVELADTDLGLKTRAEIIDPAVAEAAFAAQPNMIVPVLDGALEPSLIRVTEIEPGAVTPIEDVEPRLRQDLATRAARENIQELYNTIEDERAGGATLAEIAQSQSLAYREIEAVARDGTGPDGNAVADLPAAEQLLSDAFESDVGVENNPVRASNDSYVFYEVLDIVPPRDRTIEEAREELVSGWQAEETERRIAEKADTLLARLQAGEALPALAAEVGQPVATVEGVRRGAPPAGLSANAAAQAFAGPQGHVANAEGSTPPSRILLKVDRVSAPAFFAEAADAQAIRTQLAEAMRSGLLQSYNRHVLEGRETRINNAAYAQLTNTSQTQ
jgi:peptidyl-prolyl cis-trans isomerase D